MALGVLAALVLAHLAIAVSVARQPLRVAWHPAERSVVWPLYHDAVHRAGPGADFFAIYHAGIQLSHGESPYDNGEAPRVTPDFFPFRYLPVVAQTLGRAAIAVAPRTAYVAWIVLLELLLGACTWLLWHELPAPPWRLAAIAVLLLGSPYFLELHMGQFTFATSALLAIGLWALDRSTRRIGIGGTAAFAAAVLLKVFPLASAAALIRHRRGFLAAAAAGALVLIASAPYFVASPAEWTAFARTNFGDTGTAGLDGGNHGVVYVIFLAARELGDPSSARAWLSLAPVWQVIALGATAAIVLWRKPTMLTGGIALAFAHMVSYKHVWEHHASGAVVLAAFLLVRLHCERAWPGRWIALGCVIALALPTPFVLVDALDIRVFNPSGGWSRLALFALPMCKAIPTLVLWIVALAQSYREGRSGPEVPADGVSHDVPDRIEAVVAE